MSERYNFDLGKKVAIGAAVAAGVFFGVKYLVRPALRQWMYEENAYLSDMIDEGEYAEIIQDVYSLPNTESTAIFVGADESLIFIYVNLLRQGFKILLIGREEDKDDITGQMRNYVKKIEEMETFKHKVAAKKAKSEMARFSYFSIEDKDWQYEERIEKLKEIVKQSQNPKIVFINHAYFQEHIDSKKIVDQTPSCIFTELIAKRLEADLELQKNFDSSLGNRHKELDSVDNYSNLTLNKAKSMRVELKQKGVVIHMFDQKILDSLASVEFEKDYTEGIVRMQSLSKDYEKVKEEIGKSAECLIQRPAQKYQKTLDFYIVKESSVRAGYAKLCSDIANSKDTDHIIDELEDEMAIEEENFIAQQKLKILKTQE